jgi:CDP-glycerol glycerophosphotransferase
MLNDPAYSGYEFVWAMRPEKLESHAWLANQPRTTLVEHASAAHLREFKQCGYWVTNARLPEFVFPKPGQTFLQCWHGTPLKRLGCDLEEYDAALNTREAIVAKYVRDSHRMTWLLSPSPFATEKFRSAWNLAAVGKQDIILELGYPRNDALARAREDLPAATRAVRERLGIPLDKRVVLYAPTWRDNQYNPKIGLDYDLKVDFAKLRAALGEDTVILFRVHYFIARSFDWAGFQGFIYDFSSHDDVNDLYLAADLMITDYSSVMFDYANLGRPMVFYMYDLDEYAGSIRGFYFDLDELPGPIVRREEDLAAAILSGLESATPYAEKYSAWRRKFNPLDDGAATKRLVERVFTPRPDSP